MVETFRVESVLDFRTNVSEQMLGLAAQFREFDQLVRNSTNALRSLERVLGTMRESSRATRSMTLYMEQFSRASRQAATSVERFGRAEQVVSRLAATIKQVSDLNLRPAGAQFDRLTQTLDAVTTAERRVETGARDASAAVQNLARMRSAFGQAAGVAAGAGGAAGPATVAAGATRMATSVEATAKSAREAAAAMGRMARTNFDPAITALGRLEAAMNNTAAASMRVRQNAMAVATGWRQAAQSAQQAAQTMRGVGARQGGAGGGGGGGHGGGGGAGPTPFLSHSGQHELMLTGIGLGIVGGTLTRGVEAAFKPGADVQSLLKLLQIDARVSNQGADEAYRRALDVSQTTPGSTILGNIGAIRDLKLITGDLGEAMSILPQFARLESTLNILQKERSGKDDPVFAAAKAMEILGKMTEEKVNPETGQLEGTLNVGELVKNMSLMTRMVANTQGRVDPAMVLQFAKQGTVAGMKMSDKFLFEDLPLFLMTQGGHRTGTAFQSMLQVFNGGMLRAKNLQELENIGLAAPGSVKETKQRDPATGRLRTREMVDATGIYDLQLMFSDLPAFLARAQERMEAKGIHGRDAQIDALMRASQRSTIARFLAEALKDLPVFKREEASFQAVRGDTFDFLQNQQVSANLQALHAAFTDFETVLTMPAMKDAVSLMQGITAKLREFEALLAAHPTAGKIITEVGSALGILFGLLAGATTTIWLTIPALRTFNAMIRTIQQSAMIGGGPGKPGIVNPMNSKVTLGLGLLDLGASMTDAPPWLQHMLTGATLGAMGGSMFAGVGAIPGAVAGGAGGLLWDLNPFGLNSPGTAPPGAGAQTKGDSDSNPLHVKVTNQLSPADIRDGVSRGQADQLSKPQSGPIGFDRTMTPSFVIPGP